MNVRSRALAQAPAPGRGALGLSVHLRWGDQRVGEYFLRPGEQRALSVGSAAGVDFPMGHTRLGASSFEVIRSDADGFALRFTDRMRGELERAGVVSDLQALAEGEGELALEPGDAAWLDLGGVTLEVSFARVSMLPPPMLGDSVDYAFLNTFLLLFFVAALGVITATTRDASAENDGDIGGRAATVERVLVRLAPPAVVKPVIIAQGRHAPVEASAAHSGEEGTAGRQNAPERATRAANRGSSSPDRGRELVQRLFGGKNGLMAATVGMPGLGGELNAALGHLVGPTIGDARGILGSGLHGPGPGGGGLDGVTSVGTSLHTRGRGNGDKNYGLHEGPLGPGGGITPTIQSEPPWACGGEGGVPCLDKELIRKVIHRNRSQLRYCYELALTRNPSLNGKVSVAFTIGAQGLVSDAAVAASDLRDSSLESCVVTRVHGWLFPKVPAGWVRVTYPFVFRPAGD